MEREIKFRAWDEVKNCMTYPDNFEANLGMLKNGIAKLEYRDVIDNKIIDTYTSISKNLMQYTELKDKNGVEIYEGDIVMFEDRDVWIVEFHNGSWIIADSKDKVNSSFLDYFAPFKYRVIGNVYENKIVKLENYANNSECCDAPVNNGRCYNCKENV